MDEKQQRLRELIRRIIKKELDEEGKQQWTVYLDESGFGNEDHFTSYESFPTRQEAIESCGRITWEDYDKRDV